MYNNNNNPRDYRKGLVTNCVTLFSAVSKDRHFACEDCQESVSGGFDADTSEVSQHIEP